MPRDFSRTCESLARMRGAQAGRKYAVALEIDPLGKKRVLDALP